MSWRRFFRRAAWDDERARELRAHLEHEIDENLARGMTAEDAHRSAARKLGNVTLVREEIYRMNTLERTERLWQDLRYAGRLLRQSPGFTAVALLSLALGIGANAAIFQLLDAVHLRTLPVRHPDEVVEVRIGNAIHGRSGNFSSRHSMLTGPIWLRLGDRAAGFASLFAWSATTFDLAESGESQPVDGVWVSGGFFAALEVQPLRGRLLGPADDTPGCGAPSAVISEGFWARQFGRDPAVIGRELHLNGTPAAIVGVSPAAFRGVEVGHGFDVAVPICAEPLVRGPASVLNRLDGWWLGVMGRLAPGVSPDRASTMLASLSPAIFAATVSPHYAADDAADYQKFTLSAFPVATGVSEVRDRYEQPLWVLLAIAGLVLLIACANLSNLLLARARAREREMAVRLAIGASRGRLLGQLLLESGLLAAVGATAGIGLAGAVSRGLVAWLSTPDNALSFDLGLDWRVLAFTVAVGALTCLAFGLVPALRATRTAPAVALRSASRGLTDSRERVTAQRLLVVGQIALSLVLAVSAALFVRTFRNLATLDPGFSIDGLTVVNVDYGRARIAADRTLDFQAALVAALGGLPGVDQAASTTIVPLTDNGANNTLVLGGKRQQVYPNLSSVSPAYFRVLGLPLHAGRGFDAHDTMDAPRVAVVNEAFSRTYLPNQAVLGQMFSFEQPPGTPVDRYTIIGVVGDSKYSNLHDRITPIIYFPAAQQANPESDVSILLRPTRDRATTAGAIVAAVRAASPVALVQVDDLRTVVRRSIVREEVMATLAGFFGLLAALLAAVGLYGVMSYGVSHRRGEIGLRMALGAGRARVLRLVLADASRMVLVGLVVGSGLAFLAARSAETLLYHLPADDPVSFGVSLLLLASVALAATLWPALRAAQLDPSAALKGD